MQHQSFRPIPVKLYEPALNSFPQFEVATIAWVFYRGLFLEFANLSFQRPFAFGCRDDFSTSQFSSTLVRRQLLSCVVCLLDQVSCSWVTGKLHSNHAVLRLPSATNKPNVARLHAAQMSLRNNGFPLAAWRMHCFCSDIRGARQLRPAWV